jgi:hypothetical protein
MLKSIMCGAVGSIFVLLNKIVASSSKRFKVRSKFEQSIRTAVTEHRGTTHASGMQSCHELVTSCHELSRVVTIRVVTNELSRVVTDEWSNTYQGTRRVHVNVVHVS